MLKDIAVQLLPAFEALLAAIGVLVLNSARNWIAAHAKNATEEGVLNRLADAVATVVAEAEQTLVSKLKGNTVDGTSLLQGDAERVRNEALAKLKEQLGQKGLDQIVKVLHPDDLNALLISKIEAEVQAIRQAQGTPVMAALASTETP